MVSEQSIQLLAITNTNIYDELLNNFDNKYITCSLILNLLNKGF